MWKITTKHLPHCLQCLKTLLERYNNSVIHVMFMHPMPTIQMVIHHDACTYVTILLYYRWLFIIILVHVTIIMFVIIQMVICHNTCYTDL